MTTTTYAHIDLRPDGVPIIAGTRTKVVLLAADWLEARESVSELRYAYPDLTLGQVFSALAYYHDHQDALDREIAGRRSRAESLRTQLEDPFFIGRLDAKRDG